MTDEPQGRELDAWLAEHALGWKFRKPTHGTCCTCQRCGRSYDECQGEGDCEISEYLPAAMHLVEALTDRFHWRLSSPFEKGDKWFAGLTPLGVTGWNGRPDFEAGAAALPEAIATAAYRALKGVQDE